MAVVLMSWIVYTSPMKMGIIRNITLNITNMQNCYFQQNFLSPLRMNLARM